MKPIRYIMKCGCNLEYEGLKRSRKDRTTTTVCKEHGLKVLYRLRECTDCGEDYILSPHGPGGERCEPCRKKQIAYRRKINNQKRVGPDRHVVKKIRRFSFDPRGDLCSRMSKCRKNKKLKCKGCDDFKSVFFGFDPANLPGIYDKTKFDFA